MTPFGKATATALVLLLTLLLTGGTALALGDKDRAGKAGPRRLGAEDEELLRTRERMQEEYRQMREVRREELEKAAASANPRSRSDVPGWRAEGGGNPSAPAAAPAPEMPGPLGGHPFNAGKILLITLGLGLTALIALRVVRSVKRVREEKPMRPGASFAAGPITLTVRQRAKKNAGIVGYNRRSTTSDTSSSNASTPSSRR